MFDLAFSPDSRIPATARGRSGSTTDADSCITVWEVASAALVVTLPTIDIGDGHAIAFAAEGAGLISGGISALVAWDTTSWARVYDGASSYSGSYSLAVSPDQQHLALPPLSGSIRFVDLRTLNTLRGLSAPDEPMGVAFSPDGARFAASLCDGTVMVWTTPQQAVAACRVGGESHTPAPGGVRSLDHQRRDVGRHHARRCDQGVR